MRRGRVGFHGSGNRAREGRPASLHLLSLVSARLGCFVPPSFWPTWGEAFGTCALRVQADIGASGAFPLQGDVL